MKNTAKKTLPERKVRKPICVSLSHIEHAELKRRAKRLLFPSVSAMLQAFAHPDLNLIDLDKFKNKHK